MKFLKKAYLWAGSQFSVSGAEEAEGRVVRLDVDS